MEKHDKVTSYRRWISSHSAEDRPSSFPKYRWIPSTICVVSATAGGRGGRGIGRGTERFQLLTFFSSIHYIRSGGEAVPSVNVTC